MSWSLNRIFMNVEINHIPGFIEVPTILIEEDGVLETDPVDQLGPD